jgi:hypothetical protein
MHMRLTAPLVRDPIWNMSDYKESRCGDRTLVTAMTCPSCSATAISYAPDSHERGD